MSETDSLIPLQDDDTRQELFVGYKSEVSNIVDIGSSLNLHPAVILGACVKAGAFFYENQESLDLSIDFDKVKEVIESQQAREETAEEKDEDESSGLEAPEGFDWQREVRATAVDVVRAIKEMEIVPLPVIVRASQYLGPGNFGVEDTLGAHNSASFNYSKLLAEDEDWQNEESPPFPDRKTIPVPKSKNHRDRGVKGIISKSESLNKAGRYIKRFEEHNLTISPEDALRLTFIEDISHEYGHAIDEALRSMGIKTVLNRRSLKSDAWVNRIRASPFVHSEHFARGIEELVIARMFQGIAGIDDYEPVLNAAMWGYREFDHNAEDFFARAKKEKGLRAADIIYAYYEICEQFKDDEEISPLLDMNILSRDLAYRTRPYTREDIEFLVDPNSGKDLEGER